MAMLQGKRILIAGMLSSRSIAYGIAQAMQREGAELAFTYQGEAVRDRVAKLAAEFGTAPVLACDVANDQEIARMFNDLAGHWDGLDGIVHSVAFAPREALAGDFLDSVNREAFRMAHDISSYSLTALAKGGLKMMEGRAAALITLSYLGAERSIVNYNVMGLAKASLEANVRYLAQSLGQRGIRINAISAGPIKTLAAAGIGGFGKILNFVEQTAPMRRNVTIEDVGNAAAFLASDLAAGITGEVLHVDSGFSTTVGGMAE
jgi:enoyl-[acyl-carrier protein] reductase I